MTKHNVLYLLGAGATHAVVNDINGSTTLLPDDVRDRMCTTYRNPIERELERNVFDDLIVTPDVEHLLSILEYQNNYHAVSVIRKYYHGAIRGIARAASKNPPVSNLYAVLLDYQLNLAAKYRDEVLQGFVTVNYEDVLENTIKTHFGRQINYIFHRTRRHADDAISIFKLHGSFNWVNSRPISVRKMDQLTSEMTLWIPPGLDKKKDNYPFNLLWGQINEELARCDILRVMGCSLSRNDWGLIPILFTVQKLRRVRRRLKIEVIDFPATCMNIRRNYKYLDIESIDEMSDVRALYRSSFPESSLEAFTDLVTSNLDNREKVSPFKVWLEAKLASLDDADLNFATPLNIAQTFLQK